MPDNLDVRRKRAGFRANHRGTKEMDWLLGKYADATLAGMDDTHLLEFERFISISDPDLQKWLISPELCANTEFSGLIRRIREFHRLGQQ